MTWLNELLQREERLKQEIVKLGRSGSDVPSDRRFEKSIRPQIEEFQAVIDDYLCGRNETEKYKMNYEVAIFLPVFSHLKNIYAPVSMAI
jgi:hypothetical protein